MDVELSDSSFLDEIRHVEAQGEAAQRLLFRQTDRLPSGENGERGNTKHSQSTSHDTIDDKDELAGDPVPPITTEPHGDSETGAGKDDATTEESSGRMRTRRMPDRQKKIIIKQPPKKTPRKTVWTAERLLTDPKSPLAKADLRVCASAPRANQSYTNVFEEHSGQPHGLGHP
jgi:hypothetical protein